MSELWQRISRRSSSFLFKLLRSNKQFPGSASYWDKRYSKGGNSGSGSYNHLAEFKANVINTFVEENGINSVIDFGCGDGNQLSLASYPKYIGLDVSPTIIDTCRKRFEKDPSKSFHVYNIDYITENSHLLMSELGLSIDVIFHLIEDDVFHQYMTNLFATSNKYVIIYSSNFDSTQHYHERDRKFTDWVFTNRKDWELVKTIENIYKANPNDPANTSKSDFYIFQQLKNQVS